MSDTRALLELTELKKSFGSLQVLRGIDLKVAAQELVFIIGPSGSGKSTLLRCCNRLEEPSGGSVRFDGQNIMDKGVDINHVREHMGMVFQSFNLYPHMSVLGNVTLALRKVAGRSKNDAERRGMQALESVGLADKATSFPGELSGGQQQRAAIARAVALEPKLMLFDEPTSALDPELVGSVLEVMHTLRRARHDHAGGQPRDELCTRGRRSRRIHVRRRNRRARPAERGLRRTATSADAGIP